MGGLPAAPVCSTKLFRQTANALQVGLEAAHENVVVVGTGNFQQNLVVGTAGVEQRLAVAEGMI